MGSMLRMALVLFVLLVPATLRAQLQPIQADEQAFRNQNDLRAGIRLCLYASRNDYGALLRYTTLGLERTRAHPDDTFAIFTYYQALYHYYANALPESRQAIQVSLRYATDTHYRLKSAALLGGISVKAGHMDTALYRYHAVLDQASRWGDTAVMMEIMNSCSWAYMEMNQMDEVRKWAYRTLELTAAEVYLPQRLHAYNNLIPYFGSRQQYDSARWYIQQVKAGAERLPYRILLVNALVFEAYVTAETGRPQEAIRIMQNVIRIRQQMQTPWLLMADYAALSGFYHQHKDYASGIAAARSGLQLTADSQQLIRRLDLLKMLKANAVGLGNYQDALTAMEEAETVSDRMLNLEKQKTLRELEVRYQTAEKDVRIAQQASHIAHQKLWNGLLIGAAVLVLAALLFYFRNRKLRMETNWKNRLLKSQSSAARAVVEAEEREKQRLAMTLHDTIGQLLSAAKLNLSVLDGTVPVPEKGQVLVSKTLQLIDDSVAEIRSVSHRISPALALRTSLQESLIDLIEKIDQSRTQIQLDVAETIAIPDPQKRLAIYRIIQESLQNALKHARASIVRIAISGTPSGLDVTVQDDGVGFDAETEGLRKGQGLGNIEARVRLLQGRMQLETSPGAGARLQFYIPL
jgi:signal transduction histidine kinase